MINLKYYNFSNPLSFTDNNNELFFLKMGVGLIFFGLILFFLKELIIGFISAVSILVGCWFLLKGLRMIFHKDNTGIF